MKKTNYLAIRSFGIDFDNPLSTASGCFGFGLDYQEYFDPNELGSITLKGLTLEVRKGNPGIRIAETASGMLNSVGLENPGIEGFVTTILPKIKEKIDQPLIANINGKTIDEYILLAEKVNTIDEIQAVELNISCPNVKDGGIAFGSKANVAAEISKEVKKVLDKPLIVKLSPNVANIVEIAQAIEKQGVDALSLINTLVGIDINVHKKKPLLGNITGGLSGPAIKPVALRMVYQVSQAVDLPLVAMGGISTTTDAIEFLMAGASILAIGTAFFPNPLVGLQIKEGLQQYCKEHNLQSITEIIGQAHPDGGMAYRNKLGF